MSTWRHPEMALDEDPAAGPRKPVRPPGIPATCLSPEVHDDLRSASAPLVDPLDHSSHRLPFPIATRCWEVQIGRETVLHRTPGGLVLTRATEHRAPSAGVGLSISGDQRDQEFYNQSSPPTPAQGRGTTPPPDYGPPPAIGRRWSRSTSARARPICGLRVEPGH
jgi:hypothetical protein